MLAFRIAIITELRVHDVDEVRSSEVDFAARLLPSLRAESELAREERRELGKERLASRNVLISRCPSRFSLFLLFCAL